MTDHLETASGARPTDRKAQVAQLAAVAKALAGQPAMAPPLLIAAAADILLEHLTPQEATQILAILISNVQLGLHDTFGAVERSN